MAEKKTFTFPEAKPTPTRFRNPLSKYRVRIDAACDNCGECVTCCPYGVFRKGARRPKVIGDHLCLGPACEKEAFCCVGRCHVKAIKVDSQPVLRDAWRQAVDSGASGRLVVYGGDGQAPLPGPQL